MANTATIAWIRIPSQAIANPNSFDYYRRGEPIIGLLGKVDDRTFDYYRRLEPCVDLVLLNSIT